MVIRLTRFIADIKAKLDQMEWKDGYSYTFKGDLENRNDSFGGMGVASVMALLLIFGVLIIQFKSFTQPLIIFSALPLAIIGSILALFLTGIPFSFTAFIGLTSLIGIAINNSIVLVDYANKLRAEGKTVIEAATRAGEVLVHPYRCYHVDDDPGVAAAHPDWRLTLVTHGLDHHWRAHHIHYLCAPAGSGIIPIVYQGKQGVLPQRLPEVLLNDKTESALLGWPFGLVIYGKTPLGFLTHQYESGWYIKWHPIDVYIAKDTLIEFFGE